MTAKTKAALSAENASLYADNYLGQITAATQRAVTQDIIDTLCGLQDDNLFTSPTDSTTPGTGSLTITGGVGIAKSLSVGGRVAANLYQGPAQLTTSATAPTVTPGDNSTNIATTAFVASAIVSAGILTPSNVNPNMDGVAAPGVATAYSRGDHVHPTDTSRAPLNSPAFTGVPTTASTPAPGDNTTKLSTTAFVANAISPLAPLASPTFTGVPAAPNAAVNTNTTQLATTAFVVGQAGTAAPVIDGTATVGISLLYARQDHIHPTDTSRAPNTVFGASGASHSQGLAPDPGSVAGTTRFLREDASWQAVVSPIPSGTVMLFWQSAAPTGWTQVTTQNDKALRVVSGTGGVSGGTNAFSTVMAQTVVGSNTPSTTTMANHTHGLSGPGSAATGDSSAGGAGVTVSGTTSCSPTATGSGSAHNHTITMSIQYIDIILASKN